MDVKTNLNSRPISDEPYSVRPYADNCLEIVALCENSGQKAAEILRQLIDEALRARRSPSIAEALESVAEQNRRLINQNQALIEQNRLTTDRCEGLSKKLELLGEREEALKLGIIREFSQLYAIHSETLSASIGARSLAWKYVAHTILKESGFTDEQIQRVYEDEKRAWIRERDTVVGALEESVQDM